MANESPLSVHVWGDLACFTRPEMKVERVSYPMMTPTAARGVLEAIFWKPEFTWRVEEIWVLKPIEYFSILRNEITHRQSAQIAARWARDGLGGFFAEKDRAVYGGQRHTLALREVDYLIYARVDLRPDVTDDAAKYRDQFRRRVREGRCFATPFLGCREFSAGFGPADGSERAIDRTENLGPMLLAIEYAADGSGHGRPRFFDAHLERGVLHVPQVSATTGGG
jgi:CRISPR-associated protein Cas5d